MKKQNYFALPMYYLSCISDSQKNRSDSIDDFLAAKLQRYLHREDVILSSINHRKHLEKKIVRQLEEAIFRCKQLLKPLPLPTPLGWNIEQEIIRCEKDVMKEYLASFRDCLELEKLLWTTQDKLKSAEKKYHILRDETRV